MLPTGDFQETPRLFSDAVFCNETGLEEIIEFCNIQVLKSNEYS